MRTLLLLSLVACAGRSPTPANVRKMPAPAHDRSLAHAVARFPRAIEAAPPMPVAEPATWSESLDALTLVHERDRLGDWITVVDEDGTELCMFAAEPAEAYDEARVADLCEWPALDSAL